MTSGASALRFEMDGNEPEAIALLSTTAAILPGRAYCLSWKYDASQLSSPRDPGFDVQIVQQPGNLATRCQPFLNAAESGSCTFTSGPGIQQTRIELRYARAPGTTRVSGTLLISNIHLEFAS